MSTVPSCLLPFADRPCWVGWKLIRKAGKAKPDKVPVNPLTGKLAEVNNARTWGTLEQAQRLAKSQALPGIGIVSRGVPEVAFADLDNCLDPTTGTVINDTALRLLDECSDSYAEMTPSGRGLRIIGNAPDIQNSIGCKDVIPGNLELELYKNTNRFLTVTGKRFGNHPDALTDIGTTVLDLLPLFSFSETKTKIEHVNGTHIYRDPITTLMEQVKAGPKWHDPVLRLTAMLVSKGIPDAPILAMAHELTWPGFEVNQTRDEMAVMIKGAREKGWAPPEKEAEPWEWEDPMDFLGDANMTGAPVLSADHIPAPIAPFVFDTAARMGVDPAAVALCAIVSCASVISDDWRIQPKVHDTTWTEQPRLWGAIVGDPSILKTPVLKACTNPIDKLEHDARERHKAEMVRYRTDLARWKKKQEGDEPRHPVLDRYMAESLTIEALTEVLRDDADAKHRAVADKVLVRSDELSELLSNLDRYNGGRGGGDRGAYLRLFNGGRHTVDRIGRGSFACPNWSACILGGIQPGPIQRIARDAADDGMLQRFLYCVPVEQDEGVDRAPDYDALHRYEALFPALSILSPGSAMGFSGHGEIVSLHTDAHQHRKALDGLTTALKHMLDTTPRMKAALGKLPGIYARLCLIFHLIEYAGERMDGRNERYRNVVPEATARKAALYLRDILLPNLTRAEAVMYLTTQSGHARWIAGFILSRRICRLTRRDITRAYGELRAPECANQLTSVMNGLEAMGWVREEKPDNPARQPAVWHVNPKVHALFAARAEEEQRRRKESREANSRQFRQ